MGYYAEYSGSVQLKEKPSGELIDELRNTFETVDLWTSNNTGITELDIGGYHKYYENEVYEALNKLSPIVQEGEIHYVGEDGSHWRFKLNDGGWFEENGFVFYDSNLPVRNEFINQVIDRVQSCLKHSEGDMNSWRKELTDSLTDLTNQWQVFR